MKKEKVLDDIDKEILKILQENAKTSYRVIQDKLNISIGTIHNRIAKLEKNGIIEGYTLKLNNEKLGYKLISKIPEVCSVYHTTGEQSAALICRFKEAEDVHHFIRVLNEKEYVTKTISNMVLKEYRPRSSIQF